MRLTPICSLLLALTMIPCRAIVVFEFDYSSSVDFLDPTFGADRRASLESAAMSLGNLFDHTANVQLKVTSSNDPFGDLLASAASADIDVAGDFFGFSPSVVQQKILTGIDGNGADADGEVDVNFGQPWDLDDDISSDLFDFKATMIHEMLHAVGFSSSIFPDGTDVFDTPPGDPGVWSPFDQFIAGPDGIALIDDAFALNGSAWRTLSTGGASPNAGLFFSGPQSLAANAGQPVGLYSPSQWEEGSSGSHLDDDNSALTGMMMLALTDTGPYTRELSNIERAILEDLGYSLTSDQQPSVPELTIVRGNNQSLTLVLTGDPGSYALARSSNLNIWEPLATISIETGTNETTIDVPIDGSVSQEFFTATAKP